MIMTQDSPSQEELQAGRGGPGGVVQEDTISRAIMSKDDKPRWTRTKNAGNSFRLALALILLWESYG